MKPLALVTNDDGYASPGLCALWQALDGDFETIVVAPARGKSWIGKALSNPGALRIETTCVSDKEIFVVDDGTPADCANLGMYHLCARKPDLVVSGINIGANFTASLALASGTVGAALEGAVNGVLGVAVSLDFDAESERALHSAMSASSGALFVPAAGAVKIFLREWLARADVPRVKLVNLIVPQMIREPLRFFHCEPQPYAYGSIFEKRGNAYYNRGRGYIAAEGAVAAQSDVWTVAHGVIAYTCYSGNLERVMI